MTTTVTPAAGWELEGLLRRVIDDEARIAVRGGGTKQEIGVERPVDIALDMSSLRGIENVDQARGLVTVQAGTPIRQLERDLLRHNLMLPFEAIDLGPLFARAPWQGTVGGTFASGIGGSRSLVAGSPRHCVRAATVLNGLGELVDLGDPTGNSATAGDLLSSHIGGWGMFGVLTRIVFQAARLPDETLSLFLVGQPTALGVEAMAEAVRTDPGVTAAIHLDRGLVPRLWSDRLYEVDATLTVVRLEAPARQMPSSVQALRDRLSVYGQAGLLSDVESTEFWSEVQSLSVFQNSLAPLWRIVLPPAATPKFLDAIRSCIDCTAMVDWAGGLVWLETFDSPDASATDIRRILANYGGAATLVRAEAETRARVGCFQPVDKLRAAVLGQLKRVFDPTGVFNAGRMYDGL